MQDGIGFDNDKYVQEQSAAILERARGFGNKLYIEFGGKLLFDYHASRVLPGFDPNVKMRLLTRLKEEAEIVLCIHAGAIERKKMSQLKPTTVIPNPADSCGIKARNARKASGPTNMS